MRRSKVFFLGQMIMKQHPRNITHKGLPENQSWNLELQKNFCFFSYQGTSMQEDKTLLDYGKEAIAGQAETTAPAILTVEDCVLLCTRKSNARDKRCLLDMQCSYSYIAALISNIQVGCAVKDVRPKSTANSLPALVRTCWACCRNTSLTEPWCPSSRSSFVSVSQNGSVCDTEIYELNTLRSISSRWGNLLTQEVLVG